MAKARHSSNEDRVGCDKQDKIPLAVGCEVDISNGFPIGFRPTASVGFVPWPVSCAHLRVCVNDVVMTIWNTKY
jgi:hypothetical protein